MLGGLERGAGNQEAARTAFEEALELSRKLGLGAKLASCQVQLNCLEGGDIQTALTALEPHSRQHRIPALHFQLWKATGDRTHLEGARRLLDEALAREPEECREAMSRNLRLSREILAAWREEFEKDAPGEAATGWNESETVGW